MTIRASRRPCRLSAAQRRKTCGSWISSLTSQCELVLLYSAGIPVLVPRPERYAVHKFIVASRRSDTESFGHLRRDKDVRQACLLTIGLLETMEGERLADAFIEAWNRGPAWQEAIREGLALMPKQYISIRKFFEEAMELEKLDPQLLVRETMI